MVIVQLTGYFKDNVLYQENLLGKGLAELGHDVHVLTGTLEPDFGVNRKERKKSGGVYKLEGYNVVRSSPTFELRRNSLTFSPFFLISLLKTRPQVLFIHDNGLYLFGAIIYNIIFPKTILLWDCHSDFTNSLNSRFGSMWHFLMGGVLRLFSSRFRKFYYVTPEIKDFVLRQYRLPLSKTALLRLPGDKTVDDEYLRTIEGAIELNSFKILHSGKLPELKKTRELFEACKRLDFVWSLYIIGTFSGDAEAQKLKRELENHPNVLYLGWRSPIELRSVMTKCDLVAQPGSLSNTFIDATCVGVPLLLNTTPQGLDVLSGGNGVLINDNSITGIHEGLCRAQKELHQLKLNARAMTHRFHYLQICKQVEKDILD